MHTNAITAQSEPLVDQTTLAELTDLNMSFMTLLMDLHLYLPKSHTQILGLPRTHFKAIEQLTTQQLRALCRCPYALFDMQLQDIRCWDVMAQGVLPARVQTNETTTALTPELKKRVSTLTLSALHYVRHTLFSGVSSAKLVFGMANGSTQRFANIPLSRLQQIAMQGTGLIQVRFAEDASFWFSLIKSAKLHDESMQSAAKMNGLHRIVEANLIV